MIVQIELTEDRLKAFMDAIHKRTELDSLDEVELFIEAEKIFNTHIPFYGDMEWLK